MPDEETPAPDQPSETPDAEDESEQPDTRPAHPSDPEKQADRKVTITVAVSTALVGIIGVIGTIWGSHISVDASIRNQDLQANEARAKEDRDSRKEAYFDFLKATHKYGTSAWNSSKCFRPNGYSVNSKGELVYLDDDCPELMKQLSTAGADFDAARNKVFVYGSESAEEQAKSISDHLPATNAIGLLMEGRNVLVLETFSLDEFNRLYLQFDAIACREIPAEPRKTCD